MSSSPSSVDPTSYPPIDPTTFDLVLSGTGITSSILAVAAAAAGKSVLHLDPNPFYGSHFTSLPPSSFSSFLLDGAAGGGPHLYSHVSASGDDSFLPETSRRKIFLDLAGPRLLYCAGPMVDLVLRSGATHHVEFKSVDGSLIYDDSSPSSSEKMFRSVPDSREKIFKDKSLGPMDRNRMMRFLKLVQAHVSNPQDDESRVSEEDLEIPFVNFLHKQKLPPKIRTIFLYAIAMADYDQEGGEGCKRVISTREGIDRIALYIKSVARFPSALGAFLYPMYGHGELCQAFCRCAAVKGAALYVLRMPVVALLEDEEKKHCRGVRLASGQEIYSQQVIMEPSIRVPFLESSPVPEVLNTSSINKKVARGVCITNCSIQHDLSNILVIFPPRSLYPEQMTTVRALQLSSNVAVCPPGLFVVYFATPCDDATVGKECINAALKAVFSLPDMNNSDGGITENGDAKDKPKLLWSIVYVQELTQASLDTVCLCPMPDANLDYRDLVESTMKLFGQMYPQEEFLPATADSEIAEDDGGLSD